MPPNDTRYRPHRSMESKGVALAALCLAVMILNLDMTIVTVALPDLVRQTGATTTDLQWVVDAYNLVFAALVLVAGGLSDRLGRKGMLLAGIGVFGAASLAGSKSFSPLSTGVQLLPLAVSVAVASVAGTRLAVRIGNKVIVGAGLALFGLALLWISRESQAALAGRQAMADRARRRSEGLPLP
jgi:MFS family permease